MHRRPLAYGLSALLLAGLSLPRASPAQDESDMRARNYHVRIAVARNKDAIAISGIGVYYVNDGTGRTLHVIQPNELHYLEIADGRAGRKVYRLVVREFGPYQEESAVAAAREVHAKYGLATKAIRYPAQTADEQDRLLVAVGDFSTQADAKDYKPKLPDETIRYIFEERGRGLEGEVFVRDAAGQVVAASNDMLTFVPADRADNSMHLKALKASEKITLAKLAESRHYRGEMRFAVDEEGKLTAVNNLWIEYYLYGVVAAEMGDFAPIEALRAQAVVARSETIAKFERGIVSASELYDFVDTAIIQAYHGKEKENEKIRRAVDSTRGEILIHNGKAVDAVYSHSCGGVVSTSQDMWDGRDPGYSTRFSDRLRGREIGDLSSWANAHEITSKPVPALCNPNQRGFPQYAKSNFRWKKTFSRTQLSRMFDDKYGVGDVRDVVVTRRSKSGRVRAIRVVGSSKNVTFDRELVIRRAMGGLKSTFFTITKDKQGGRLASLTIYGAGFGHGVGLCQMGAYMMARLDYNHRQILGHYFSSVKIRRLYG